MATQINMPKLGLSMKEGTIAKWLKAEGDAVKKGEALLEIMTDKIVNKVDAPCDGILLKITADKKTKLPIGGLMGIVGETGEDISALLAAGSAAKPAAQAQATALAAPAAAIRVAGGDKVKISPAARKLAEENGIDRTTLAGTGPEGRIVREDVEKAMAEAAAAANVPVDARPVIEVIPYEGMRQVIGENMVSSYSVAPKVTHMVSVDVLAFGLLRAQINSDLKDAEKISVTDLLVKAVAKALERHPRINSTLSGESIKILKEINIGVAVALTEGLIVPVVKDANKKSIYDVSGEIRDFGKRARKNRVAVEEMTGSTFTISNVGGYGSVDWFTPIINQPESAILGVGRTVKMPVVVDDQIAIRPMMGLSLAFDHRVIDGAPAAEFLATLLKLIEKPHKIFI